MNIQKTKRLEILENSLVKKNKRLEELFSTHFASVRQANGQPLNDKRNGHRTMAKWERQNEAIRNCKKSIEITVNAIEREKSKITSVSLSKEELPKCILDLIEKGVLIQWRKYPNRFFVEGVERARIIWLSKKKRISHSYLSEIPNQEQYKKFAKTYNALNAFFK